MNEKFYALSREKQQAVIQAGYRVFKEQPYRKCPVGEIAKEAGISKSLLFFYFKNKKELYLFLLDEAIRTAIEEMGSEEILKKQDFFGIMEVGMKQKLCLLEKLPDLSEFIIRAYYEKDGEVLPEIRKRCEGLVEGYSAPVLGAVDQERFLEGLDLPMMYQEMFWASDGYLRMLLQKGELNRKEAEEGFQKLVEFWKSVYLRRE